MRAATSSRTSWPGGSPSCSRNRRLRVTHAHAGVSREDGGCGVRYDVVEHAAHQTFLGPGRDGEHAHLRLVPGPLEVGLVSAVDDDEVEIPAAALPGQRLDVLR